MRTSRPTKIKPVRLSSYPALSFFLRRFPLRSPLLWSFPSAPSLRSVGASSKGPPRRAPGTREPPAGTHFFLDSGPSRPIGPFRLSRRQPSTPASAASGAPPGHVTEAQPAVERDGDNRRVDGEGPGPEPPCQGPWPGGDGFRDARRAQVEEVDRPAADVGSTKRLATPSRRL